jgi:hypothetical protein
VENTTMPQDALYDEDILLWSEQQADIIRKLGRTRRDLPNDFDVENVAEEIESVGRSELAAVKSLLRQILIHLVKMASETPSAAEQHWRDELAAFQAEAADRYAPSMRQRLDLDALWQRAVRLSGSAASQPDKLNRLSRECPFGLEELLNETIDPGALTDRLRRMFATGNGA